MIARTQKGRYSNVQRLGDLEELADLDISLSILNKLKCINAQARIRRQLLDINTTSFSYLAYLASNAFKIGDSIGQRILLPCSFDFTRIQFLRHYLNHDKPTMHREYPLVWGTFFQ